MTDAADRDLDADDLACAGLHRAGDSWSSIARSIEREINQAADRLAAMKPPAEPRRRVRKPSLESQVRQMLKAGQAAGVQIAVTVEGGKVTASPARVGSVRQADTSEPDAPSGRALFTTRAVPKQKVVL
jgi:hypothetical protein